ncbi:MAG: prepilin-type N-terminal cleavage/methylation domain-containing protein [Gallionella sp.]|nr:prepilin-type N-terminal cleavage/methylation domain-containing protein [Gallionella sp.]
MYVNPNRHDQRGLTLIELIMFIVIVSVGLAGILLVINTVVKSSADPVVRKQSIAMADAILEEVLLKAYQNPAGGFIPTNCAVERALFDDASDYTCFDGSTAAKKILGDQMIASSTTVLPDTFWAKVEVTAVTVSGASMKKVTVTVTDPSNAVYALSGYRGNY